VDKSPAHLAEVLNLYAYRATASLFGETQQILMAWYRVFGDPDGNSVDDSCT